MGTDSQTEVRTARYEKVIIRSHIQSLMHEPSSVYMVNYLVIRLFLNFFFDNKKLRKLDFHDEIKTV